MNASEIIKNIETAQLKAEVPEFRVGDTVKVYGKIKEGNRERIQVFETLPPVVAEDAIDETVPVTAPSRFPAIMTDTSSPTPTCAIFSCGTSTEIMIVCVSQYSANAVPDCSVSSAS